MIFGRFTDEVLDGTASDWARLMPTSRVKERGEYTVQRTRMAKHLGHFRAIRVQEIPADDLLTDGWNIDPSWAGGLCQVFDIVILPMRECCR